MFTAEEAIVYQLVSALFKAQHSDVIEELQCVMDEFGAVFRLADMKMCMLKLETLPLDSSLLTD